MPEACCPLSSLSLTWPQPPPVLQVDYFKSFLQLQPSGAIDQSHVRFLTPERDVGINSGIYTFNIVKDGKPQKVRGRGAQCGQLWLAAA